MEGEAIELAESPDACEREEYRAEVILYRVPVQLDIVVTVDERERVPVSHEAGKRVEHVAVALYDETQLDANVVDGAAQAVLALLGVALCRQRGPCCEHRDSDEIDEVTGENEAPAIARKGGCAVVLEQLDEVFVDAARATNRPTDIVQVAPEVNIGQDEQAIHVWSRRKTQTRLRVRGPSDLLTQGMGHRAFRARVSGTLPKHN